MLRGVTYQVRVALLKTFDLLERQLLSPTVTYAVTLEALVSSGETSEKWDLLVTPQRSVSEIKVQPTAQDMREWLKRSATTHAEQIVLVYGRRRGRVHAAVENLLRLCSAAQDEAQLARFLAQEPALAELAELLGPEAHRIARRMRMRHVPPDVLEQTLEDRARALAAERAPELLDMLVRRLLGDAERHKPHLIGEMLTDIRARGLEPRLPDPVVTLGLPVPARRAMVVLQRTGGPLAATLLAQALSMGVGEVEQMFQPIRERGLVRLVDGAWELAQLPGPLRDPEEQDALARTLRAALEWISKHKADPGLNAAVDAAIRLSELVGDHDPSTVTRTFAVLDKLLKRRGEKRLVLEVAERSIAAAERAEKSPEIVQAHAIALICGRSWVRQRVGQLGQARIDAERSLQLGESIDSRISIAFCHKCLGRLYRLEAEDALPPTRARLLADSVAHLNEARACFEALGEEAEAGDALSLLAHTHLRAGRLSVARRAVAEAERRLRDPCDKDFFDLLLVRAELEAAEDNDEQAEQIYAQVLDQPTTDAVPLEARARALHARGRLRLDRGRTAQARADFVQAAEIFEDRLEEADRAALSELEILRIDGRLPVMARSPEVTRLLEEIDPLTRVEAVYAHEEALKAQANSIQPVALRAEAPIGHWRKMISEGGRRADTRRRDW